MPTEEAYFNGGFGIGSAGIGEAKAAMTLDMIHVEQKRQKEFIRKAFDGIDAEKEPEKFPIMDFYLQNL